MAPGMSPESAASAALNALCAAVDPAGTPRHSRSVRAVVVGISLLFSALSCSALSCSGDRSPPTSQHALPPPTLTAWVLDADGPVADASVQLVALPDGACPCSTEETLEPFGNAYPTCNCPSALERLRERLDRCGRETRVLFRTKSDGSGRVEIPLRSNATAIEVSSPQGIAWVAIPETTREIALELQPIQAPRVTLSLPAASPADLEVRGALFFQDGHCVPLGKQEDLWLPIAPVTRAPDDEAIVLFDAPGYAPAVASWYGGLEALALSLGWHEVGDVCSDEMVGVGPAVGATVTYQAPLFHARTTTDARGRFSFRGVPHRPALVECRHREKVLAQWWFDPDRASWGRTAGAATSDDLDALGPDAHGWQPGQEYAHCHLIEVVDSKGKAVEGARVIQWLSQMGLSETTDIHGRTCMRGLPYGGKLSVQAPELLGGPYAGSVETVIAPWSPTSGKPPRTLIRLKIEPVHRATFRGRLVTPEGLPVAGGHVYLDSIALARDPTGGEGVGVGRWATTEQDGTFDFGLVPMGTARLLIHHPWYAEKNLDTRVSTEIEDFTLERGASWSGTISSPEGERIKDCRLFLRQPPSQRLFSSKCPEFSFRGLSPGSTELKVSVHDHPVLADRQLTLKTDIKNSEARRSNVRWPAGATIAGEVVDESGRPRAGVSIWVVPKDHPRAEPNRAEPGRVSMRTDKQGRFSFRHLEPGTWVLSGHPGPPKDLEVETGTTDLRVIFWK